MSVAEHPPQPVDLTTPQLTLRALMTGMVMGGILSACNVYTGLTIGWSFNMSVTAVLLSFALWQGLHAVFGLRYWTRLENNINQTAASSAAAVSSAGLVAPIPALTMMTGFQLTWPQMAIWVFSVCLVGILVAVPVRRQLIVVDKLRFPAGLANAEMLREMYAKGAEAFLRVSALAGATLFAAMVYLFREIPWLLTKALSVFGEGASAFRLSRWPLPLPSQWTSGFSAGSMTLSLDPSMLMIGAGGIMGFRTAWSLLLGAILAWVVVAPPLVRDGTIRLKVSERLEALPPGVKEHLKPPPDGFARYDVEGRKLEYRGPMTPTDRERLLALSDDEAYRAAVERLHVRSQLTPAGVKPAPGAAQPSFPDVVEWLLWPGVTLMVIASLVSFGFSWPAMVRTFQRRRPGATGDPPAADTHELAVRWTIVLLLIALGLSVVLQVTLFGIQAWMAVLGVLLTYVMALVAARVSGETNTTPVGAMGKVTQLAFGALSPANPTANLMTANVTGGAASQCADLLHDLKTGYLIGAAPWKQLVAQICGAAAGAMMGSMWYLVLIPSPQTQLITEQWAAPAVATWKAVAELFQAGLRALPPGALLAMSIAAVLGVVLPILERKLPPRAARFVPSPAALGLAFVINGYTSIAMFLGGLIALVLSATFKAWSARFLVAIFTGLIAGESLAGAGYAIQQTAEGLLTRRGP